jgi:predicted RNA polymerase sigma factor
MSDVELRQAIDAIRRIESLKLIASLARMLRDVGRAEELAQDAFVCALTHWPDVQLGRLPEVRRVRARGPHAKHT